MGCAVATTRVLNSRTPESKVTRMSKSLPGVASPWLKLPPPPSLYAMAFAHLGKALVAHLQRVQQHCSVPQRPFGILF